MHSRLPRGVRPHLEGKPRTPLSSRVATRVSWSPRAASRESSLLFRLERGPGLLSRPCRKRRPSAREDGGVSGVSSSCGALGGFLARHDEDLREPLVRRQGSQVSMRVARGSASLLSSHGRGLGPRDALKDSRSFSGGSGKPSFPSPSAGDLMQLPRVPLRGKGSCGGGGAPRDSAGSGGTE